MCSELNEFLSKIIQIAKYHFCNAILCSSMFWTNIYRRNKNTDLINMFGRAAIQTHQINVHV